MSNLIQQHKNKLTLSQLDSIKGYANTLGTNPDNLIAVMILESNVNPAAVNPYTGATGLIQFMPSTAISLGTTVDKLKLMPFEQQMAYVYLYLKPYKGKLHDIVDLYLAIFFPRAIGKPTNYKLETASLSASKIATQNPAYDLNKDYKITKGEVETAILKKLGIEKKKLTHGIS